MRTIQEWRPILIKGVLSIDLIIADETDFYIRVIPMDYDSDPVYFLIDKDWHEVIKYDSEQIEAYIKKLHKKKDAETSFNIYKIPPREFESRSPP